MTATHEVLEHGQAHIADSVKSTMKSVWKAANKLEDVIQKTCNKEEMGMNDIAGLLALMQGNKSMDLPGLLALCKEKGYNDQGFGGQSSFMFVFFLLFLMSRGGFGALGGADQAAFTAAAGNNCQEIIGIHDRISAAQAATSDGFARLDTKLCSAIAEVIASVRNQGDRVYDSVQSVSKQIADCCCALQSKLDAVLCAVRGVESRVELAEERTLNRINQLEGKMELGFERQACLIKDTAKDQQLDQARRDTEYWKEKAQRCGAVSLAQETADETIRRMQAFSLSHYTPTVKA